MGEFDRWSNLHSDLLNEVVKRIHCYVDYIRLRCVCKRWNLELPKTSNHPWLVLPFGDDAFKMDGFGEKEIYHLRLPEIQNNLIRGSCHGWLIIVMISDGAVQMLNPYTKAHFYLPPISTFPDIIAYQPDKLGQEYTWWDIRKGLSRDVERIQMHKSHVYKIVISSPPFDDDFMAVAIYGEFCRLAFCRLGDHSWTDVPTAAKIKLDELEFQDVIFHAGKIYAINWKAQMYEFDMKAKPLPLGGMSEVKPPRDLVMRYANLNIKYLIGRPNGSLLMLVRHFKFIDDGFEPYNYQTYKFDIYTLKKDAELTWSRIYSLGNYVLMLGLNSSIWMLPHIFSNGKGNCIYYTDNQVDYHYSQDVGGHDIGVLNLEDGTMNQLFPNTNLLCPVPVWLLPY